MGSARSVLSRSSVRRSALVAVLGVASLAVWQGVAGAGALHRAMAEKGKVPIEQGNGNCGDSEGDPVIGQVTIQARKKKITVDWKMKTGDAKKKYTIELWNYSPCFEIAVLGTASTDKHGQGGKSFEYKPSVMPDAVFTDSVDSLGGSDSLAVTL